MTIRNEGAVKGKGKRTLELASFCELLEACVVPRLPDCCVELAERLAFRTGGRACMGAHVNAANSNLCERSTEQHSEPWCCGF